MICLMLLRFNSIKVRLERAPPTENDSKHYMFQFHKGTIRTKNGVLSLVLLTRFNSIKVRLELILLCFMAKMQLRFNSIKVRLELHLNMKVTYVRNSFNSIKVRLEPALVK